jgi:hypothetical protein
VTSDSLGELVACPECSAPAQLTDRSLLFGTDGPVEHARIRCVRKHRFYMPTARVVR